MRLIVHRLAVREINDEADRYREISTELEARFTIAVEHAFALVRAHPLIGHELARGERRLLIREFPYKMIYHPHPDRIFIVAIAHHKRREGYWRRRREPFRQ
jgi:toxin ParE1/3/4